MYGKDKIRGENVKMKKNELRLGSRAEDYYTQIHSKPGLLFGFTLLWKRELSFYVKFQYL